MKEEIKDILIDKYYEEDYDKQKLKDENQRELKEFEKKLNTVSNKMNVIEKEEIDIDINFLSLDFLGLIEKGENIREEKRKTKESIWFVFVGFILLMLVGAATVSLGIKFIIYFEIVVSIVAVISAGLLVKYYLKGEKS